MAAAGGNFRLTSVLPDVLCTDIREVIVTSECRYDFHGEKFLRGLAKHIEPHAYNPSCDRARCDICLGDNQLVQQHYPRVNIFTCKYCVCYPVVHPTTMQLPVEVIHQKLSRLHCRLHDERRRLTIAALYMQICGLVTTDVSKVGTLMCSVCRCIDESLHHTWSAQDDCGNYMQARVICDGCNNTILGLATVTRERAITLIIAVQHISIAHDVIPLLHEYVAALICADATRILRGV